MKLKYFTININHNNIKFDSELESWPFSCNASICIALYPIICYNSLNYSRVLIMRSLHDRAVLLLETIIGKEELAEMLKNETGAILQGGFYSLGHSDMQKCIRFGYSNNSLSNGSGLSYFNQFKTPFSTIENDENKYLRVYVEWKNKSYDINNWIDDHNSLVTINKDILSSVFKMFEEDSVFEVKYDFEEFEGVATRFYKFGFRLRGGRVKFQFISANLDLTNDSYFWKTLSDFIASRYAVYVPADLLKLDYSNIIDGLPEQIAWSEFEERYADPQYGKKS